MQIDGLSILLSSAEVSSLLLAFHLPGGGRVNKAILFDNGIEANIRSATLGIPIRLRAEIQSYGGSSIVIKVYPPVAAAWFQSLSTTLPAEKPSRLKDGLVEFDLVSLSKGLLSSLTLEHVSLDREALSIRCSGIVSQYAWADLLKHLKRP